MLFRQTRACSITRLSIPKTTISTNKLYPNALITLPNKKLITIPHIGTKPSCTFSMYSTDTSDKKENETQQSNSPHENSAPIGTPALEGGLLGLLGTRIVKHLLIDSEGSDLDKLPIQLNQLHILRQDVRNTFYNRNEIQQQRKKIAREAYKERKKEIKENYE